MKMLFFFFIFVIIIILAIVINKNDIFFRSQVIKACDSGKNREEIVNLLNRINGAENQITYSVN